jgi:DNA-binding response OmpR family regulator
MPSTRILVIEDDPDMTALFHDILEEEGYRVIAASGPLDSVDISQLRPRLIVLDLWYGDKADGWDLLHQLRTTPGARDIPVLVCTADSRVAQEEAGRLRALGADVILKPFDLDDFLGRVAATLGSGPRLAPLLGPWAAPS